METRPFYYTNERTNLTKVTKKSGYFVRPV